MPKIKTEQATEDGWSRWIMPVMKNYRMVCCDCGLSHDMEFGVLLKGEDNPDGTWEAETMDNEKFRVEFRARRNARSTAQVRRHRHKQDNE